MGVSAYLSLIGRRRGWALINFFCLLRIGAYSRWVLIRGWALIRINTVSAPYVYLFHFVIATEFELQPVQSTACS